MPVRLIPMQSEQYPTWFARQAIAYAEDKVRAKQWGLDGAEERARQETESLPRMASKRQGIICSTLLTMTSTQSWARSGGLILTVLAVRSPHFRPDHPSEVSS